MKLLNKLLKRAKVKEINVINFNDSEILIIIIECEDQMMLDEEIESQQADTQKILGGDMRILYVDKGSNVKFVKYKKPIEKKMTKPQPPPKRRISKSGK